MNMKIKDLENITGLEQKSLERVGFFLLGMMFAIASSTYTMWLGEKYNLVEHKIEYTNVISYVPANSITKSANTLSEAKRSVSDKGIMFIKQNEGMLRQAVWDVNGISVGWGHKINSRDPKWLRDFKIGQWISASTANELFANDIENFLNPSLRYALRDLESSGVDTKKLSQGFVDGMADMIYNCGLNGMMTTDFYYTLKKGHIDKAISLVPSTRVYCEGHKTRREKTYQMMADAQASAES